MSDAEWVPSWCSFFSPDEYAAFRTAVQHAVSSYGVDDIEMDQGWIELVAGEEPDECSLTLHGLAAECRDNPGDLWERLCFSRISDFVEGQLHRDWLVQAPFAEVEPRLRVWRLTDEPETLYEDPTDDSNEPYSIPLAPRLYVSLIADVPELDEADEASVLVPNSAVAAWQLSAEDLLESARRRLRSLPAPTWSTSTVRFNNHRGPTEVELHVATATPDADESNIPVSAWFLLIDEIFPHPLPRGGFVSLPERHSLIVVVNDEQAITDTMPALSYVTKTAYDEAPSQVRGTRQLFAFGHGKGFQAVSDLFAEIRS